MTQRGQCSVCGQPTTYWLKNTGWLCSQHFKRPQTQAVSATPNRQQRRALAAIGKRANR